MKTRSNIRTRLAWAASAIVLPALLHAQPSNPKYNWLNHYQAKVGNTHYLDEGRAIAYYVPAQGTAYVYVAGNFTNSIVLGSTTLTGTDGQAIYIARINAATGAVVSAVKYDTPGDDVAYDIMVTSAHSLQGHYVYLAGRQWGAIPLLARYSLSLSGAPIVVNWGHGLNGTCNEADMGMGTVSALAQANDRVYATGWIAEHASLECATTAPLYQTFPDPTDCDNQGADWTEEGGMFVARFSNTLTAQSLIQPASPGCSQAMDMMWVGSRLYITGRYYQPIQFNSSAASALPNPAGEAGVFVCSASTPNSNTLPMLFDRNDQQWGGSNEGYTPVNKESAYCIAGNSTSIFIGGTMSEDAGAFGSITGVPHGPFVVRYPLNSTTGMQAADWCNSITNPGLNAGSGAFGMSLSANNLYVTGATHRNSVVQGKNSTSKSFNGSVQNDGNCGFLVNYDVAAATSGNVKWASRINDLATSPSGTVSGQAVVASSCNLFYTGSISGANATFGNTPTLVQANTHDSFVGSVTGKLAQSANTAMTLPVGISPNVALSAQAEGAATYAWTVSPAGPTFSPANAANTTMTIPAGSGTVVFTATCTMTGTSLCSATHTTKVTVTWSGMQGGGGEDGSGTGEATVVIEDLGNAPTVLSFYPNPANDRFVIRSSNYLEDAEILLLDATGRVVRRLVQAVGNGDTEVSIVDLEPGTYICSVLSAGVRVHAEKVVVQH